MQPKGSMATAEDIARIQAQAKKVRHDAPPLPPPEQPPAEAEKTAEQVDAAAEFKKAKAANEKAIGIVISDADITDYIFQGRIVKDKIQAVKGKIEVTFQTLTPKELEMVDEVVAKAQTEGKNTKEGISNIRTIEQMTFAWLAINGKPLPKDLEKRKEAINRMGTHVVNRVVESFKCFDVLIEMTLREEEFLKK
jgi:hypothetical protein